MAVLGNVNGSDEIVGMATTPSAAWRRQRFVAQQCYHAA
jgi:hypothetical protein